MLHKFFLRRFRNYFLLMLIPVVIVFIVFSFISSRQLNQQLNLQSENTLKNINTDLDFVISNLVYQNNFITSNVSTALALKRILALPQDIDYLDAVNLRNIQSTLRSMSESYSYIVSIYLYLDDYEYLFTSDKGVRHIDSYSDHTWRNYYDRMSDNSNMVIRRVLPKNHGGAGQEVLTFYHSIDLMKGVIVVNIDIEKYKSILSGILNKQHESLYFFNRDNELLIALEAGRENVDIDIEKLIADKTRGINRQWVKHNKRWYLFNYDYNEEYGISIVSMISMEAMLYQFKQYLGIFGIVFVINVFVVLCISYITTDRNFKQINYMVEIFNQVEKGIYPKQPKGKTKDEYDVVMNNIIHLFLDTVRLNSKLKEKEYQTNLAELKALQSQINPHFLYNTLQSFAFEIAKREGKTDQTSKAILDLSDILKYSLANPTKLVPLSEEVLYLRKYAEIQRYRFGDQFIIYYEIDDELRDFPVFRLLLQPLVENSILHGIRNSKKKGYIKIKAFILDRMVKFHVTDNGVGMSKTELNTLRENINKSNSNSIGLSNVNSRLVLHYGEESSLHIRSVKGRGTSISFHIPYQIEN
ncbi:MAG: sensor histidine kinase [Clostridiaceae bacterium]|nr:sensor histidine kinase [Clostridiaceae bacterium]